MALIKWQDEFSVNIPEFDAQHKHLFYLLNRLHDAISQGKGGHVVGDTLDEMTEYAEKHFRAEEDLMREKSFPGLDAHAAEHAELRKKLIALRQKRDDGQDSLSLDVLEFLRGWFTRHVTNTDGEYGAYLAESALQGKAADIGEPGLVIEKTRASSGYSS